METKAVKTKSKSKNAVAAKSVSESCSSSTKKSALRLIAGNYKADEEDQERLSASEARLDGWVKLVEKAALPLAQKGGHTCSILIEEAARRCGDYAVEAHDYFYPKHALEELYMFTSAPVMETLRAKVRLHIGAIKKVALRVECDYPPELEWDYKIEDACSDFPRSFKAFLDLEW